MEIANLWGNWHLVGVYCRSLSGGNAAVDDKASGMAAIPCLQWLTKLSRGTTSTS